MYNTYSIQTIYNFKEYSSKTLYIHIYVCIHICVCTYIYVYTHTNAQFYIVLNDPQISKSSTFKKMGLRWLAIVVLAGTGWTLVQ